MQYMITPPRHVDTRILLPASKSISNRALIIHALTGGNVMPENLSDCDDTKVIIRALSHRPEVIDIKAAGTAMRFMTAYLSVTEGEHTITGTERMKHRPIGVLVDALRYLGAEIEYAGEKGFPPLRIRGRQLEGGRLEIPGNVSSQYISALLMIAPVLSKGLEMKLTGGIVSRPYIDLTLHLMHQFGVSAEWTDIDSITVKPQPYRQRPYTIENDWTAASYWYEVLALTDELGAKVVLPGMLDGSRQGDSAVRYIFSLLGIKTAFADREADRLTDATLTRHSCMLNRMDYDFTNQPDLAQTLIATCPVLGIPFHFTGLGSLRIKETDRIEAMKTEMEKLGYILHADSGTELSWEGDRCEPAAQPVIDTYEDHRMAMSFAPLAIRLGRIGINHPEVVSKSYPHYWNDLRKAGFHIVQTD
ncbi:putative 3-phosphoshikimate 1-carboxyvinyltransferase [Prevotella denticola CRIS 18C-A]|uniref:3-phosphoshikimate 1-carboxyvinyltransferase n=1 Tax=Prevotella denticola CRIS 18C-A TaxID=944557 RepID=F0H3X3_9BACT|nr:3-phosphoshikimate 1-carboxyvinyltransferase [Prevotella denticola]EGC87543.1 putative 3-phosphoshikimate 1-carboxyvinyltransferase [Prevotella denticola CRIS 18C-A]KGF41686.1 3-phosphoshikimate 1-carboxyvinyltransferase [Prevotella denticola DNF00960]QUB89657.1 3-phosphoshikimate 1-carboxyvinyltransferase [Prevotella denticola]